MRQLETSVIHKDASCHDIIPTTIVNITDINY